MRPRTFTLLAATTLALGGCQSFSPDGGTAPAARLAVGSYGSAVAKVVDANEAASAQEQAAALLRRPLTPNAAVQVALLRNRGLQAAFNDLGVSEAQFVQATLPPVPRLSLSDQSGSMSLEITRSAAVSLIELLTLPARQAIAGKRFEGAQYRAAEAVARLAAETQRQFYRTVAANQSVAYLAQALSTAESASILAKSLGETGALNKLEQAREHAFYVELGAQLAKARVQQQVERERLVRQLGLWGPELDFKLPGVLPPLHARPLVGQALEAQALTRRTDLRMARVDLDALAGQYGLTAVSGFVSALDVGYGDDLERTRTVRVGEAGASEVDRERRFRRGVQLDLTIPIYDFGQTAVRGAREAYLGAANRLAERAVNARSQVREAYGRYRGNLDIARHYQATVLPLRQTIQDQALLQYSGMLVDVTQLIIDARARILSNIQAIEARRDFWIADADLKASIVGGMAEAGGDAAPAPSLAAATPD